MVAAPPSSSAQLAHFEREVERVRIRAMRVAARAGGHTDQAASFDARTDDLQRRIQAAGTSDRGLGERLGLTDDERELVWAVVAASSDPLLAMHLPPLGPRSGRAGMSLAQLAVLLDLDASRAGALTRRLQGDSPLIAYHLIEVDAAEPTITPTTALLAAPRLIAFLAGSDALDPALEGCGRRVEIPAAVVLDRHHAEVRERLRELLAGDTGVIILQGKHGSGRRTLARLAADRPVIALDLERVPRKTAALAGALAALLREALLAGALPLVAGVDDLAVDNEAGAMRREVGRFADRCPTPVFVTATLALPRLETARPTVRLEVPLPDAPARAALWRNALGADAALLSEAIDRAAVRFQVGPSAIRSAVTAGRAIAHARGASVGAVELADGVRTTVEERLHGLARRYQTPLGWDDVVLPPDTREQIDMMIARVRHSYQVLEQWQLSRHLPGPGVAALFSGPPGTGKTLVAGIMGHTLGLEVYRVDLAQIVSKWIGETEKQLDAVFTAAETGHAILLFDEADALFAKRTEVKGATERYANLEVNFLLQRIESFAGIAILTTNLDGSLDPALRRRLAAHIQFPQPEEEERRELWKRMIPRAAPLADDLDLDALAADFPGFAGAHIRNAVTTAAFLAAAAGTPIGQEILRRAAGEEARAMGRVIKSTGRL